MNEDSFSGHTRLNGSGSAVTPLHYVLDSKLSLSIFTRNYIEDANKVVRDLECSQRNLSLTS
jgi:hypothetical protein